MQGESDEKNKVAISSEKIGNVVNKFIELLNKENRITSFKLNVIKSFANSIEAKDTYTKSHCDRVTMLSILIGKKMELSKEELIDLEYASLLHDIGKIQIPDDILNKKGKLTKQEFETIKKHPEIGYEIIKDVKFLRNSAKILLEHHERIDGNGYPKGLKGQNIEKLAKIIAVADSFDAMTSERTYRKKPLPEKVAIKELINNKGTQFDEQVVDIFVKLLVDKKQVRHLKENRLA